MSTAPALRRALGEHRIYAGRVAPGLYLGAARALIEQLDDVGKVLR